MRLRISIAKKLIRLGAFVQSLAVPLMRPDDLTEFGKLSYSRSTSINEWTGSSVIQSGLKTEERSLIGKIPVNKGSLLLLGIGGGREAIPFAKLGFKITGLDFIPEMVKKAGENMEKAGFKMEGLVQDLLDLKLDKEHFDVVWLSSLMYSSIPTRRKRIVMSGRIFDSLKPGGYFACQFHWSEKKGRSLLAEFLRKLTALITMGNFRYQRGDKLWYNLEFTHIFSSKEELSSEFEESGFKITDLNISGQSNGEILLYKPEDSC